MTRTCKNSYDELRREMMKYQRDVLGPMRHRVANMNRQWGEELAERGGEFKQKDEET